jgi:anti-sigma regulatory factor (Ser/Thr protein kinase)
MDWRVTPDSLLDISVWMPSEIKAITPLVERLLQLVEESHCLPGDGLLLELALREALYNTVVYVNRLDSARLVQVRCRCERQSELYIVVRDHGQGCDLNPVPDSVAAKNPQAEHGRGILPMGYRMDGVWLERRGTEVHMWIGNHTHARIETANRERTSYWRANRAVHGLPDSRNRSHLLGGLEVESC